MRCSECSHIVKPVVAIDIDGTLGDYHGHFIRFAQNYLHLEEMEVKGRASYEGSGAFRDWFTSFFRVPNSTWYDIKLAYRQGGMKRTQPIFKGATSFVAQVHESGAEVWLTTTRPHLRLDGIDPDTRNWLEWRNIQYDGLLYDEEKYAVLSDRVDSGRVVAILDDLGYQYDEAERVFGPDVPILRRNPYNSIVIRANMARDFDEALRMIQNRINVWYRKYGEKRERANT